MRKQQNNSSIHTINLAKYTTPEVKEYSNKDYVEYGKKNDFFQYLIDRYTGSTTHNAIVNGICKMIYGRGIAAYNANKYPEAFAQLLSLFKKDDLRRFIKDRYILGMASFQVVYKNNKVVSVSHFPMNTLRPEKMNEDGEIEAWHYHHDWENKKMSEDTERIDAFGFGSGANRIEMYVLKPYVAGYSYFSPVDYVGALPYAFLEEEIADYLINDVQNGFSGTKIINFNNGIPEAEKQELITKQVTDKVTGARGLKTIVSFNSNQEAKTTIDDVPLNDAPEHYQYLSDECRNKLIVGHRVTSPMLIGVRETGGGLGNNADEIRTANLLFDNVVINAYQEEITDVIEEIIAINGIAIKPYFKTLEPVEFTNETQEKTEMSSHEDFDADSFLDSLGEYESEDWELLNEQEVDYEKEQELDAEINLLNNPKKSIFSKIWEFVSSGTARPNSKSEQDKKIGDFYYFVRYQYTGSTNPQRDFCKKMMSANKVYRKEDIEQMSSKPVNKGWGPNGADTYDIFKYKGGGSCHHKWLRKTYKAPMSKMDVNNPLLETISTNKAEKEGYRVRNPKEVAMMPKDMPYEGFLPTNKRFQ